MHLRALRAFGLAVCLVPKASGAADHDWPSHDRDPGGQRFSPLTQITTANVATLERAWTVDTGATNIQVSPSSVCRIDSIVVRPVSCCWLAISAH